MRVREKNNPIVFGDIYLSKFTNNYFQMWHSYITQFPRSKINILHFKMKN